MPPNPPQPASTCEALCPRLHRLLERVFSRVIIANQGEEMVATYAIDGASRQRRLYPISSGEYYRVNCPFCNDTRHRLWINHRYGQPDLGNGRSMTFLAICYNENCLDKWGNRRRLEEMIFGLRNRNARGPMRVLPGTREPIVLGAAPPAGLCQPIQMLPDHHVAVQYLCGVRGYSRELLTQHRVSYCDEAAERFRLATHRAIIPIFMDGLCVGWQARYVGDDWEAAGVPKYYSLPGMHKNQLLYNFDNAKNKPFVVVVEGMTDVWRVGDHAVALLGKTMSAPQRLLLQRTWLGKPIVLVLDGAARLEMEGILPELIGNGCSPVIAVYLPDGYDPGDYAHDTLWNIIYDRATKIGVTLPKTPQE